MSRQPSKPVKLTPPPPAVRAQYDECRKLIAGGRCKMAIGILAQLAKSRPNDPELYTLAGQANEDMGRHAESAEAYGRASAIAPYHPQIKYKYVAALRRSGRYEDALEQANELLAIKKSSINYARVRAACLADLGRHEEAAEALRELLSRRDLKTAKPAERVMIGQAWAVLPRDLAPPEPALELILDNVAHAGVPAPIRATGYAHAGQLLEKLDRCDEAFDAYQKGKDATRTPWDPDEHSARIDALIDAWRSDPGVARSDVDGSRLVFIVGMMRSGSSMTEQMLSQSPGVTPGGEMNAVSRPLTRVDPPPHRAARPVPINLNRYTPAIIESIRAEAMIYYDAVAKEGVVTDKQTTNYLVIPLLGRLFPGCKVVHTIRDPQDTCLSNFAQAFGRPHPFTHDLEWLGRYHRDYQRLMSAWHELGDPPILDFEYEKVIADPEGESKRLYEFVGLEWTANVLSFHESDRIVVTSSRQQVRRPIYKSSLKRHQRFAPHLGPLRRGLGLEE